MSSFETRGRGIHWKNSIRTRLFLAFSALVIAVAAFIFLYFPAKFRDQSIRATQEQTQTLAQVMGFTVSPALVFDDPSSAEEAIQGARQDGLVSYLVVTDAQDSTFAAFGLPEAQKLGAFGLPDAGGFTQDRKYWQSTAEVKHQGKQVGKVRVGYSLANVYTTISATQRAILLLSLAIIGVGIFVVYWMSKVFTRNLSQIVKVVNNIGEGEINQRAEVRSSDEVGLLAHSFNTMLNRLDDSTAAIRQRERQYRLLAENMNEGLVQIDANMQVIYANPKFCAMFGIPTEAVQGLVIHDIVGERNLEFAQPTGTEDRHTQFELETTNTEGVLKNFLISYSRERTEGITFINAIFTDISALKKTERDLVYKNRELDTFVYKASHDLKAPLSSLRGILDIAKDEFTEARASTYLGLMNLTVEKMDDVLMGLLEVTWIKQGQMEYSNIRVEDFIQTLLRSIEHAPGYDSTRIELVVPQRFEMVSDAKLLNSILQNIIFNAVKYHSEEGSDKWVRIEVEEQGRMVVFSVKDNGPGIPKEAQDKLFDMFFRASKKSKGSGLGLYIVKNSVEKMGGTVVLKSEEGVGTEFIVRMPKLELPEKAPQLSESKQMPFK